MELTTKGIIIRIVEHKDNAAVITIFSCDLGIISALCYGIHSIKSGKAGALLLFMYGEFSLSQRNGMYTIKTASALENFENLSTGYDALVAGSRLVSCANTLFQGNDKHTEAFELLYAALSFSSYSDMHYDDIYAFFLLHSLKLIGLCPCITHCAVCGNSLYSEKIILFSNKDGGSVCVDCSSTVSQSRQISKLTLEAMRRILLVETHDMAKIKLPDAVRVQMLSVLDEYVRFSL